MTEWVFFIVPLLVLPIVLLFRFVGCNEEPKPEDEIIAGQGSFPYKETILAEPSVLAYWRLVDPTETKAKEEKGPSPSRLDGEYKKPVPESGLPHEPPIPIPGTQPPTTSAGSEQTSAGGFAPDASLISALDSAKCRAFNGGHVVVEGFKKLGPEGIPVVKYPEDFTIEAWIKPQWTVKATGYEHTLIDAGGNYVRPGDPSKGWHGFRIFARVDNKGQDRWQVYLAQPDGSSVVEMKAPIVAHNAPTHLAVTVKTIGGEKEVIIFVDGKNMANGTKKYSPPDGAPLFIGVSNDQSDLLQDPRPRRPVMSPIQEVVLYSKALPPEVIKKHHDAGRGIA